MATGARSSHDRTRGGWSLHELQTVAGREFVLWPHRLIFGLLFLWGIVLVGVARLAPRSPALPTIVALVLVYGGLASLPIVSRPLPLLGAWQPRMFSVVGAEAAHEWQGNVLVLMAGAMTAAAVWGWWRHAQERQLRRGPNDGGEPRRTVG